MKPTSFLISFQLIHSCLVRGFAPRLAGTRVLRSRKPSTTSERSISSGTTATGFLNIPASTYTIASLVPPIRTPIKRKRKGKPSYPAWKNKRKLDEITEWATSDGANRPVICEYEPDAWWLWTKWRGTALSMTYVSIIINMGLGIFVDWFVHTSAETTWSFSAVPPADEPIIQKLVGMQTLWEYQLTLCTFILAFFTSQAYSYWRSVYFTTRAVQGRINDCVLILTATAKREEPIEGGKEKSITGFSPEAEDLVHTCTRLLRLSHTFFWAAEPTNSNGVSDKGRESHTFRTKIDDEIQANSAIGPILLSPEGLRYLELTDELTHTEVVALLESGLPPSQYCYMLIEWVMLYVMDGLREGLIEGGAGTEQALLKKITDLRAEYFSIGDYCAGRMPLAYVQLVQVLVDSLVWLAPFSLYSGLGSLSIPLVGLLTLFFKGLLELSKSFLDPFGNEGYPGQNIRVDVLVSELNFGAASRWVKAAQHLPSRTPTRD